MSFNARSFRNSGRALLVVAAALLACACAPEPPAAGGVPHGAVPRAPEANPPIRPLVTIVVDQMGAWVAEERWPLLPGDGGFARLRREGTIVRELRFAHAVTDTAPGHSALYTGAVPRASGIWINDVLDAHGKKAAVLRDERTSLVGVDGPIAGTAGSSLAALDVPTVADGLRAAHPDALIVSLSLKDRGALFGGGRRPTASLWFDVKSAQMVSSTAVCSAFPPWAKALGSPAAIARTRSEVWRPLDPRWDEEHAATADPQEGEGDAAGLGVTFPHALASAEPLGRAFRTTPMADDLLLALALAAVDAEYRPGRPTLLALSLSANDYIGHTFGPDSWEAWDELTRLDGALGRFFAELDRRFGKNDYDVLLTGDHGVTTMPEAVTSARARPWCAGATPTHDRWGRACGAVTRLMPESLGRELEEVAVRAVGDGQWVLGFDDPYVILTPAARALPAPKVGVLKEALALALRAHPEVAQVIDVSTLPEICPPQDDESIAALVCRSTSKGSGDLYVVTRPGSFFDPDVVPGKGTSHGTPYLYDRAVPLAVRAPGRVPARAIIDAPVGFGAFARTASALLGIPPPRAAEGARDLTTR
jgi:hypothetical protein